MSHGQHRFNPQHVAKLLNPDRLKMLPPEQIVDALQISQDDNVADLGCGPGVFTLPIAKRTQRTVYAIDVERQMLELLQQRTEEAGVSNVQTVLSDAEKIDLPDQSVDKVLIAFVLHEVGDLNQAVQEVKRILRPNGNVLILEWEKKETEMGPPVHHRLDSNELQQVLVANGLQTEVKLLNDNHYMVVAQ
ncbi:class I SAM-dependent methyltransferase [Tumebacillus sp. ITR2]|uniref:Class I SAM-dependent methyltransferase n=1 Tax=Tumebacillus amylolyticus TaxID=2801339 RepID=A0ABS1J7J2_9BACL|nr:methyltransferase domain-containing protein [Tumebacillus amylolyticus]MBL0385633.1 class I SAM-dependent methyltransferase [Tumebacillus amylolyticus]